MRILVCMKQVPDMESTFRINATGTGIEESELAWRINEYDEYAIEQAVQIKEQVGSAEVTLLCVGPMRVQESMKKGLAMGVDRAFHIFDEASANRDPFVIASLIADYAREERFDLILTGMQSQDRGSAQVGVMVAELLGQPALTTLVECTYADGTISGKRELEGGIKAAVSCSLPAVVTCQLGLNTPRYPTLPNIMKAKKKELLTIPVAERSRPAERLTTTRMAPPQRRSGGMVLEGEPGDLADRIIRLLKEKTTVLA